MNKKPYNQIEEQMKAATQGWEPAFDEQAWQQMEQLLEKDDDRKRPFAWWLLLIPILAGIATAGYFTLYKNDSGKNTTAVVEAKPSADANAKNNIVKVEQAVTGPQENTSMPATNGDDKHLLKSYKNPSTVAIVINAGRQYTDEPTGNFAPGNKKRTARGKSNVKITAAPENVETATGEELQNNDVSVIEPSSTIKNDHYQSSDTLSVQQQTLLNVKKQEKTTTVDSAKKSIAQKKKSKQAPFYFSLYGGIEGNGVNFPGLNKFSPRTGFTAGYYLTRKISVQAGFFAGSKKYVAGKYDYKAKPGTYWSMVDITKVDANCRVFEIPVSLRYDFKQGPKFTSFAGIGLSSFIMDKEDYAYDYIYYNQQHQGNATYKGNQHWFSVLRIYGGFEKKISNNFSLGLQPGIAIPLRGVGEGQIKLFSSELLINLKYQPFKKAKGNQ